MLSTPAWNAFLKTLEEPPAGTVFVLATTEVQKVPATVIDRCHCFDFHRPSAEQIAAVLRRVAQAEQIELPPEAVAAIARAAGGSFRDALGTLEQLVTYSGDQIVLADVLAVLGVVDAEALDEMLAGIAGGDSAGVLLALSRCLEGGRDAGTITSDLEARARDLLVVRTLGEVPRELSLTPEADARLAAQADSVGRATIVRLLELLARANEATRAGADARTQLELALVKATSPDVDESGASLLARLERLESRLPAGADSAGTPPASPNGPPSRGQSPAAQAPSVEAREESREDVVEQRPQEEVPAGPAADAPAEPQEETGEGAGDGTQAAGDLGTLREQWPQALELIRAENALLGALIAEAQPVDMDGDEVTLAFAPSAAFLKRKAEDRTHYATVAEQLRRVTGRRVRLSYELRDDIAAAPHTRAEEELVARLVAELDAEELPAGDLSE
jgi:DNA polymerase-3 subunit gamma/tau